jgi:hypothetical protein
MLGGIGQIGHSGHTMLREGHGFLGRTLEDRRGFRYRCRQGVASGLRPDKRGLREEPRCTLLPSRLQARISPVAPTPHVRRRCSRTCTSRAVASMTTRWRCHDDQSHGPSRFPGGHPRQARSRVLRARTI